MQIWAESGKSALPICNYSQILYQFLTFTQNLKRSRYGYEKVFQRNRNLNCTKVGSFLKELRKEKNITQEQLAESM